MRIMLGASGRPECSWSERLHLNGVQALYVHIPFCAHKCVYCDFASWATASSDPPMARYEAAIESQIQEAYALGLLEDCQSAYVGGGTPTLLGAELGRLVSCIRTKAPITELSCEANPDSLTDEVLLTLKEAGATRISLGVQSFCDAELLWLGRIHSAKQAFDRVRAAASMGFDVSCDVMCALKGQTQKSWQQTLATFLELDVDHVSVCPLKRARRLQNKRQVQRRLGMVQTYKPTVWKRPRRSLKVQVMLAMKWQAMHEITKPVDIILAIGPLGHI